MTEPAVAAPQALAPQQIWAELGSAERERAFDNLGGTTGSADWTRDRDAAAAAFRASTPALLDLRYGPASRCQFDLYPGADAGAPCLVFVHGGYWQRNARENFAHYAKGALDAGWSVAVPGHTLAPQAGLATIAAEIRAALDWLAIQRAADGLSGPVVLSGWSAGGHLATLLLDHPLVAAGLSISGLYDLGPLKGLAMDVALKLTDAEIEALSPLRLPISPKPLAIAYGTAELPAFQYEALRFHETRKAAGAPGELIAVPGANHFTILDGLLGVDGPLVSAASRTLA